MERTWCDRGVWWLGGGEQAAHVRFDGLGALGTGVLASATVQVSGVGRTPRWLHMGKKACKIQISKHS